MKIKSIFQVSGVPYFYLKMTVRDHLNIMHYKIITKACINDLSIIPFSGDF